MSGATWPFFETKNNRKPCGHIGGTVSNVRKCGCYFDNITCVLYFSLFLSLVLSCFLFYALLCYVSNVPTNKKARCKFLVPSKTKDKTKQRTNKEGLGPSEVALRATSPDN